MNLIRKKSTREIFSKVFLFILEENLRRIAARSHAVGKLAARRSSVFGNVSGLSIAKVNSGNAEATRRPPTRGRYSILRNPFIAQALLLLMQPTNSSGYLVLHPLYLSRYLSLSLSLSRSPFWLLHSFRFSDSSARLALGPLPSPSNFFALLKEIWVRIRILRGKIILN